MRVLLALLCAALSIGVSGLAGCANQASQPGLYLLRSEQAPSSRTLQPSAKYALGRVSLAPYINQRSMVLEAPDGQMQLARHHLWAEPLSGSIRKMMTTDVSSAHGEDIMPRALSSAPMVIDIHIDQMHGSNDGQAVLVAQWWLRQGGKVLQAHQFADSQPLSEDGYAALARAEQNLLSNLAERIAASLP